VKEVVTTVWDRNTKYIEHHEIRPGYSAKEEVANWMDVCEKARLQGKIGGFIVELKDVMEAAI